MTNEATEAPESASPPELAAQLAELSRFPHQTYKVRLGASHDYESDDEDRAPAPVDQADVWSSAITNMPGWHTIMIDIDRPMRVVPSSTSGRHHLYIDVPVQWPDYERLLHALVAAGVVEPGYVSASVRRRASFLRLPWVRKRTAERSG